MTDPTYCPWIIGAPCLTPEVWVACWQTLIAALAAIATFLAVLAALTTSEKSINAARELAQTSRDELDDRLAKQRLYLATAYVEELRENAKRLFRIRFDAENGTATEKRIWHLFHSMTLVQAPVLDSTINEFSCFETSDAALFLRTAAKLSQVRRHGSANRPDTLPADLTVVLEDVSLAVSKAPEMTMEAMNRAYAISGIPKGPDPRIEVGYNVDTTDEAT